MNSPADLERMSPTMREPEGEPIQLGGTMLEPANDGDLTPEDVEEEVRRIEADHHINQMKRSGEWDQRRLERGQGL